MTVDLLFVRAFVFGKPILYLSSEASDPATAAIERAIYVLALSFSSFSGGGGIPDNPHAPRSSRRQTEFCAIRVRPAKVLRT